MKLAGKSAIITGGATGIGRASALLFAREGARIAIADINDAEGARTVGLIKAAGGEAVFIHTDVTSTAALRNMVRAAVAEFGKLDILFSNAGIGGAGAIEETSEETFDRTIAVNLKSGFFAAQMALPELLRNGGGCILFTGSGLGMKAAPQALAYALTKAAIHLLTRSLAVQYGKDNIRVNAILPGPAETAVYRQTATSSGRTIEENTRLVTAQRPIPRLGTVEEMAAAALFLVSPENAYITGVCLPVDGGDVAK